MSRSRDFLQLLKNDPKRIYIIHYSSQSLYDAEAGALSPRITSVVVRHYVSGQTVSFATHTVAETLGIGLDEVEAKYDQIEGTMLTQFYEFVRDRRSMVWVHCAAPYVSVVVELDTAIIADLVSEIGAVPFAAGQPVRVDRTDAEVADAALRLMRLLDRPTSIPILQAQLLRELHFWLLSGQHGGAIRALGVPGGHAQRIARAVNLIRTEFTTTLPVERLAESAGMGLSSFHEHFRAQTSLTPLQFQKQLRLIEARRLMLSLGEAISNAAYAVGYESVPQFTREYGRLFGLSPARDIRTARQRLSSAA